MSLQVSDEQVKTLASGGSIEWEEMTDKQKIWVLRHLPRRLFNQLYQRSSEVNPMSYDRKIDYWKAKLARGTMPEELALAVPYYLCATAFGWSPEQVDKIPYSLLMKLLTLAQTTMGDMGGNVQNPPMEGVPR